MGAFRAKSVRNTPELARIRDLPVRALTKAKAARAAARWTSELAVAGRGAELRPWQGQVLDDVVRVGGCVGWLPVGQGKTLPAELVPVVLAEQAAEARRVIAKHEGRKRAGLAYRAVLCIPASLKEKTFADRRSYAGKWRLASPPARIVTLHELAREANAGLLEWLDPEVLVVDESDELANWDASATQRIHRFVKAKRARGEAAGLPWPHGLWVVAMTGTPTRRSILGYWHILVWCLGPGCPMPVTRSEAESWALALDDAAPRMGFRPNPGPLGSTLDKARARYLDRLRATPGMVMVDEDSAADVPLTIKVELAPECDELDAAFDELRLYWTSPSGEPVSDPLSLARIDGDLGCGVVRYWKPPPPPEWLDARRELAAFIRKRISETRHAAEPLDTDAQVIRRHKGHPIVAEWLRVRRTFDPRKATRTRWISDVTLRWAVRWIRKQERLGRGPVVVWCGGVEFGTRLAKLAGLPYYSRKGKEINTGRDLHAADVRKSMVCSWHANKRGFNLQAWRTHAIVQPPQSAKYLEQIFGRSHRAGQTEPVRCTVLATSGGTLDAFAAAIGEARFAKQTAFSTQKILKARIKQPTTPPDTLRWAVKRKADI